MWKKDISNPLLYLTPHQTNHHHHHTTTTVSPSKDTHTTIKVDPVPETIKTLVKSAPFHLIFHLSSQPMKINNDFAIGILVTLPLLSNHPNFSQVEFFLSILFLWDFLIFHF